MGDMGIRSHAALVLGAVALLATAGCREDLLAPGGGTCPDFCPPEQLQVVDSVLLDNVLTDSAFAGYVQPYDATSLQVYRDSTAGGDAGSRAVIVFQAFSDSLLIASGDTTRGAVLGTDSFVVLLPVRGRNPSFTGLEVALYRIPVGTDSATAFADLDPYFTDSTLIAVLPIPDSLVSDTLPVTLDSLAFPGLGDFYLGHKGFATLELLGGLFAWFVTVVDPLVSGGLVDAETGEVLIVGTGYWITIAIFIGFMHSMDAIMTHHFAQKGHHPA